MKKFGIWIYLMALAAILINGCGNNKSQNTEELLNHRVDSVLALMTLEEKLGQLSLLTSDWDVTGPVMRPQYVEDIRAGRCGNIFNAHTVAYNTKLQRIAVEETRLGIPLMFGYDVIHGHKTIFPVPLAEACSWNLDLMEETARLSAMEAAASGLCWTFGPMLDISRDPRWGRVTEGNGEDTYLASRIAEVRVRGIQGDRLSHPHTLAACVKHFAAYGAPVAGRDYNTVDMSELAFRQDYLPPYEKAVSAGAVTVMASFNDIFGVPATASGFLMNQVLREEMGFDGFVVTDYTGIDQLRDHGVAKDRQHAGELALKAGIDMDMQSVIYSDHLARSLEEGKVTMEDIDTAVRRILKIKFRLGLFDNPYLYLDEKREQEVVYSEELLEHALKSARESIVLLKNEEFRDHKILPLQSPAKIALLGPLGDNKLDMLGSWHAAGDPEKVVSLLEGIEKEFSRSEIKYLEACDFYSDDRSGFSQARNLALQSDVVILALGEREGQSGEAASRSEPGLPGIQEEFANMIIETGKPVVLLILAERPLTFPELNEKASAVIYGWHLGTRAGDALAEVLSGRCNPSAKLVMSIPRNVGQIPVYYNQKSTGRPFDPGNRFTSKYLDVSNDPLYPFGFGLSYNTYTYSDIELSDTIIGMKDSLIARVRVKNTGEFEGDEIVQLYTRDLVGSITRPVKELKGFEKIHLLPGEEKEVLFSIKADDLEFVGGELKYIVEPGDFMIFIGPDSENLKMAKFTLK